MDPINYIRDIADPMQMTLQGYAAGSAMREGRERAATQREQFAASGARADRAFGLQERRFGLEERRFGLDQRRVGLAEQQFAAQQAEIAAKRASAEAMQSDYAALIGKQIDGSATADDYKAMVVAYPQLADPIMEMVNGMTKEQTEGYAKTAAQIFYALNNGHADMAMTMIDDFAEAARASGDTDMADMADIWAKTGRIEPGVVAAGMGVVLTGIDPDLLAKIAPPPKPLSEAEAKISRLMETTNPTTGEPFTRQEAIETTQLNVVAADGAVVNRASGEIVNAQPSKLPEMPESELGITDFGAPGSATGLQGGILNAVNVIADAVGLPMASPEAGKAKNAMNQLATETMLVLSADFPGRPSNLTREEIAKMTIKPNEVSSGSGASLNKVLNMYKMVRDALVRADEIATSSSGYTAAERSEAKQAYNHLLPLFSSYKKLKIAFENSDGSWNTTSGGVSWRVIE